MKGKKPEGDGESGGRGGELIFGGGLYVRASERGHGGMRPGIHYNAVSNIMIQAHARRVVTAVGKSPGDGGDGKVTSLQNERRDER